MPFFPKAGWIKEASEELGINHRVLGRILKERIEEKRRKAVFEAVKEFGTQKQAAIYLGISEDTLRKYALEVRRAKIKNIVEEEKKDKKRIERLLKKYCLNKGVYKKVSSELKISPATLKTRMRKYRLDIEDLRRRAVFEAVKKYGCVHRASYILKVSPKVIRRYTKEKEKALLENRQERLWRVVSVLVEGGTRKEQAEKLGLSLQGLYYYLKKHNYEWGLRKEISWDLAAEAEEIYWLSFRKKAHSKEMKERLRAFSRKTEIARKFVEGTQRFLYFEDHMYVCKICQEQFGTEVLSRVLCTKENLRRLNEMLAKNKKEAVVIYYKQGIWITTPYNLIEVLKKEVRNYCRGASSSITTRSIPGYTEVIIHLPLKESSSDSLDILKVAKEYINTHDMKGKVKILNTKDNKFLVPTYDKELLFFIFQECLDNAFRYSDKVWILGIKGKKKVIVKICNRGRVDYQGLKSSAIERKILSEEELLRIKEEELPFVKGVSTKKRGGLGLSIVRALVEEWGGSAELRSSSAVTHRTKDEFIKYVLKVIPTVDAFVKEKLHSIYPFVCQYGHLILFDLVRKEFKEQWIIDIWEANYLLRDIEVKKEQLSISNHVFLTVKKSGSNSTYYLGVYDVMFDVLEGKCPFKIFSGVYYSEEVKRWAEAQLRPVMFPVNMPLSKDSNLIDYLHMSYYLQFGIDPLIRNYRYALRTYSPLIEEFHNYMQSSSDFRRSGRTGRKKKGFKDHRIWPEAKKISSSPIPYDKEEEGFRGKIPLNERNVRLAVVKFYKSLFKFPVSTKMPLLRYRLAIETIREFLPQDVLEALLSAIKAEAPPQDLATLRRNIALFFPQEKVPLIENLLISLHFIKITPSFAANHPHHYYNIQKKFFDYTSELILPQNLPRRVHHNLRRIVSLAEIKEGSVVLDVGSGTGALILHLISYKPSVIVACEISKDMVDKLKKEYMKVSRSKETPELIIINKNILQIDLPQRVNYVFFNSVWSNLVNKEEVIHRVRSFLSPQYAKVIISHPEGKDFINNRLRFIMPFPLGMLPERYEAEAIADKFGLRLDRFIDESIYFASFVKRKDRKGKVIKISDKRKYLKKNASSSIPSSYVYNFSLAPNFIKNLKSACNIFVLMEREIPTVNNEYYDITEQIKRLGEKKQLVVFKDGVILAQRMKRYLNNVMWTLPSFDNHLLVRELKFLLKTCIFEEISDMVIAVSPLWDVSKDYNLSHCRSVISGKEEDYHLFLDRLKAAFSASFGHFSLSLSVLDRIVDVLGELFLNAHKGSNCVVEFEINLFEGTSISDTDMLKATFRQKGVSKKDWRRIKGIEDILDKKGIEYFLNYTSLLRSSQRSYGLLKLAQFANSFPFILAYYLRESNDFPFETDFYVQVDKASSSLIDRKLISSEGKFNIYRREFIKNISLSFIFSLVCPYSAISVWGEQDYVEELFCIYLRDILESAFYGDRENLLSVTTDKEKMLSFIKERALTNKCYHRLLEERYRKKFFKILNNAIEKEKKYFSSEDSALLIEGTLLRYSKSLRKRLYIFLRYCLPRFLNRLYVHTLINDKLSEKFAYRHIFQIYSLLDLVDTGFKEKFYPLLQSGLKIILKAQLYSQEELMGNRYIFNMAKEFYSKKEYFDNYTLKNGFYILLQLKHDRYTYLYGKSYRVSEKRVVSVGRRNIKVWILSDIDGVLSGDVGMHVKFNEYAFVFSSKLREESEKIEKYLHGAKKYFFESRPFLDSLVEIDFCGLQEEDIFRRLIEAVAIHEAVHVYDEHRYRFEEPLTNFHIMLKEVSAYLSEIVFSRVPYWVLAGLCSHIFTGRISDYAARTIIHGILREAYNKGLSKSMVNFHKEDENEIVKASRCLLSLNRDDIKLLARGLFKKIFLQELPDVRIDY